MDKIRNIVVPTDFSPLAEAAAARAAYLARLDGAAIHLVHAMGVPMIVGTAYEISIPTAVWDDLRRTAREQLDQARKSIEASGVQTVTARISDVIDPAGAISEAVKELSPELVVMGTHGRGGIQRAFLGSVAERALRTVDRPILAVKEDLETAGKPIAKILLAVDFSPHSDRAIEVAAGLAKRLSASVDVIHAFDLPAHFNPYLSSVGVELERRVEADVSKQLDAIRERLEKDQIRAQAYFRQGRPEIVIADAARQIGCQLIVMGTRGRSGLSHVLLGSVAERTMRAAPCSVLCARAADAA
jgi:nucleotide-binding universal stress UspA family protein